ncbi:MAG: HupE/UreJ family protein [Alteraurantiacibacter sp.]
MSPIQRITTGTIVLFALVLPIQPALAHESDSLALGFQGGFLHPLAGLDHLLAMVAVGIWGAFLGRPLVYLLPIIFPAVMAFGGVLAMAGMPLPPVEVGIALSVLVLGLSILFRWRPPVWLAALIVALFGLFHGYAHGLELPSMANPVSFSLGFVIATGLLHVAGIALGLLRKWGIGEQVLRAAAAVIAIAGLWFLVAAAGG